MASHHEEQEGKGQKKWTRIRGKETRGMEELKSEERWFHLDSEDCDKAGHKSLLYT